MGEKKGSSKKIILGAVVLVMAVIAMLMAYQTFKPKAQQGSKSVVLTVVSSDESKKEYKTNSDVEFLQQLMDELETEGFTYAGNESSFGLMVDTVNGVTASFDEDGSYWAFFLNGEYATLGIAEQPVTDGDHFEIVYTSE